MPAFVGKARRHRHELTSAVRQAIARIVLNSGLRLRDSASHIWIGGARSAAALAQHGGQVFSGVLPAGKVQGHRMRLHLGQDVRGEGPFALGIHPRQLVALSLPGRRRSRIRMVVSSWCSKGALAAWATSSAKTGWASCAKRLHQLPLGRLRQRHPQALLEPGQPVMRHPGAVTQQRDRHRPRSAHTFPDRPAPARAR